MSYSFTGAKDKLTKSKTRSYASRVYENPPETLITKQLFTLGKTKPKSRIKTRPRTALAKINVDDLRGLENPKVDNAFWVSQILRNFDRRWDIQDDKFFSNIPLKDRTKILPIEAVTRKILCRTCYRCGSAKGLVKEKTLCKCKGGISTGGRSSVFSNNHVAISIWNTFNTKKISIAYPCRNLNGVEGSPFYDKRQALMVFNSYIVQRELDTMPPTVCDNFIRCHYLTFDENRTRFFQFLEFADQTLKGYLQEAKQVNAEEVDGIFIQILYALHCAQKRFNFKHGDFHTENIMLKDRKHPERPIILEFSNKLKFKLPQCSKLVKIIDFDHSTTDRTFLKQLPPSLELLLDRIKEIELVKRGRVDGVNYPQGWDDPQLKRANRSGLPDLYKLSITLPHHLKGGYTQRVKDFLDKVLQIYKNKPPTEFIFPEKDPQELRSFDLKWKYSDLCDNFFEHYKTNNDDVKGDVYKEGRGRV